MPRARKTVDVALVKDRANHFLNDEHTSPAERRGVAGLIESVLLATENYQGFQFTDPNAQRTADHQLIPNTYDDTRRRYF